MQYRAADYARNSQPRLHALFDAGEHVEVAGMRRVERRPQRDRHIVHAVHGAARVDAVGRDGEGDRRRARGGRFLGVERDQRDRRQVLAGRLREVGHRVAGDHHRAIGLAAGERVGRRVFAGIESRIAAGVIHAELIAGPPGDDVVGAGHVAVAAVGLGHESRVGVHVARERQQGLAVAVLAAGHREAHAEEDHAELGRLHAFHQVLPHGQLDAGLLQHVGRVELDALGQRPQRPQGLEILARLDLDEDVGRLGALGPPHVDDHAGAVLAAVGQEHALGHEAVLGEVPRMALGRVRAPEHDEVAAVGHFAERTRHFAHALKRHARRAVADARRGVDRAADPIDDAHGHALRFARRIAQAVARSDTWPT